MEYSKWKRLVIGLERFLEKNEAFINGRCFYGQRIGGKVSNARTQRKIFIQLTQIENFYDP